jgi:pantoate--beta-alanine ligase
MKVITTVDDLRQQVDNWAQLKTVFVPTMGNLHAGHLALVRAARNYGDKVIVSIFVNPLQFGANEDLASYPRTPEADQALLKAEGVDVLFLPGLKDVYPHESAEQKYIEVQGISEMLEGKNRPDHFRGVATVVHRLFDLVKPDVAIFGKKDYQQLLVIKQMVVDQGLKVEIVGQETVREADGLAMSSRNQYLSADERKLAPALYQTLQEIARQLQLADSKPQQIIEQGRQALENKGFAVDYLVICRQSDLRQAEPQDVAVVILIAARLGNTRLIDNLELNPAIKS